MRFRWVLKVEGRRLNTEKSSAAVRVLRRGSRGVNPADLRRLGRPGDGDYCFGSVGFRCARGVVR